MWYSRKMIIILLVDYYNIYIVYYSYPNQEFHFRFWVIGANMITF